MIPRYTHTEGWRNRAVSPVIGVILMVAITVILAAVIGAFVLEIGDQQETAPSTSFDVEQEEVTYQSTNQPGWIMNQTTVSYTHAGGDVIDINSFDLKVNGNGSVWGVLDAESGTRDLAGPQPYKPATFGTNEPVEYSSGEQLEAMAWNQNCHSDANVEKNGYASDAFGGYYYYFEYPSSWDDSRGPRLGFTTPTSGLNSLGECDILETGDDMTIVWTAESGGKTQTLQKYSVQ